MSFRVLVLLLFLVSCGPSEPEHGRRPRGEPGSKLSLTPSIDFDGDYQVEVIDVRSFFRPTTTYHDKRQLGPLRLVAGDKHLYVSGLAPQVLILDNNGVEIRSDGETMTVPGLLGLAAWENELAAVSRNEVIIWRDGLVTSRFKLPVLQNFIETVGFSPRCFDFDANQVLVPWSSRSEPGHIGTLYDREGKLLKQAVDAGFDQNLLELSQLTQASLWDHEGGIWYQAYMFYPKLTLYDPSMEQITAFGIDSPAILEYEHYFFSEDRTDIPNPKRNQPLFSDFEVSNKIGYLLGNGVLHRIELHSGEVTGRYRFRAPKHKRLGAAHQLKFTALSLQPDGSLVLGGGPAGNELFISNVFALQE